MTESTLTSPLSSTATAQRHSPSKKGQAIAAALITGSIAASYLTRKHRCRRLEEEHDNLPLAKNILNKRTNLAPPILLSNVERAGLQGTSSSVKEELGIIRKWHHKRGYLGGLVVRELTQPLFGMKYSGVFVPKIVDPLQLHQRECYYLYYELKGNGEIRQQIFCRGTTLLSDVYTCLQLWFVFDEELCCKLHKGFKEHADRLLEDVEPLLAPSQDPRATVELCGHSLGGAVAYIVAMKLRKRGYNVVRVTSVGAPRLCHAESVPILAKLIPEDNLRIEDDFDPIPYLPPFSKNIGNKLWFTNNGTITAARYAAFGDTPVWVDSLWLNFRVFEILSSMADSHRIANYTKRLKELATDTKEDWKATNTPKKNPRTT